MTGSLGQAGVRVALGSDRRVDHTTTAPLVRLRERGECSGCVSSAAAGLEE